MNLHMLRCTSGEVLKLSNVVFLRETQRGFWLSGDLLEEGLTYEGSL